MDRLLTMILTCAFVDEKADEDAGCNDSRDENKSLTRACTR